jgi:hypothetical protein
MCASARMFTTRCPSHQPPLRRQGSRCDRTFVRAGPGAAASAEGPREASPSPAPLAPPLPGRSSPRAPAGHAAGPPPGARPSSSSLEAPLPSEEPELGRAPSSRPCGAAYGVWTSACRLGASAPRSARPLPVRRRRRCRTRPPSAAQRAAERDRAARRAPTSSASSSRVASSARGAGAAAAGSCRALSPPSSVRSASDGS